ncbi:arginine-glutamic acid dipeptide repeats protein-like isoform X2 [Dysidea avara]|uniref:arginine-glutamic acid dipeptide repeats protein-like isoform X2 n=1 Tax=Dysidea avara TaxID=196820 RepID=UPI00332B4801
MPPKRNERGKKNRKAKANGSTTSSQGSLSTLAKRSPPTRKAKAKAGKAVKRNVAIANNTKPLVSVGKRKSKKVNPIFFTADDGEQYRVGDYAYVDAERSDLPYHICRIRDLKTTRKEHVVADVTWFYRPSEVPESIYLHLLEDQQQEYGNTFKDKRIKERQLFISLSCQDLRPLEASLFRGKCEVFQLTKDTPQTDLERLFEMKDQFFYSLAYNQESRQFTYTTEELFNCPYIPQSQQAVLPEIRSFPAEGEKEKEHSELVWEPAIEDDQLLTCLRAARSIALHAGLWINGYVQDGYLAASSDQTTQTVFDTLFKHGYDTEKVLKELVKKPMARNIITRKQWSFNDSSLFAQGIKQCGKHFSRIQLEYLPNKNICELIEFYYHWKKTSDGMDTRTIRRQKKQQHIKTARQYYKIQQDPNQELDDIGSAEEDEGSEEIEKDTRDCICAHCSTRESPSWHHAGPNKQLMCDECCLYYNKYGEMRPFLKEENNTTASQHLSKDYLQTPQMDKASDRAQGTKKSQSPENGNGDGTMLRSGRVCKPSDTSEESTEGEDYEESGEDDEVQEANDEEEMEESDCSEESDSNPAAALSALKKRPGRSSLLVHLKDKAVDGVDKPLLQRDLGSQDLEDLNKSSSNQGADSSLPSPSTNVSSSEQLNTSHNSSHLTDPLPNGMTRVRNAGCARTDLTYTWTRPKNTNKSVASSVAKPVKTPQSPIASTPSVQHTPLISVYTPTMSVPPSTPFVYPHVGEMYNHEQAAVAAMGGLAFQRPHHFYEQERLAEFQRIMYHKQQQHGMHAENHMMSPAMMQHPYLQGMVMYPEMLAAAGGTPEEMMLRQQQQQRMMAAAAVAQVAPHTPSPEMNHFQFDPRVVMQYNAMPGAHQEEQVYVQMMEARLTQFVQHVMPLMQQPGFANGQMLQPEFVNELQKHYDLFRHLLLRNPANQHNPLFLQIGQVLEHLITQQRASMEHPVKSSVIVNSSH